MEIIINTVRNVFLGITVLTLNIPVFWSFHSFIDFISRIFKLNGQN